MKLLLVIVSIIAVATVDRTDFPDGREDLDSAAGEPEDHNSAETEHEQKEYTLPIQDSIIENDAHHFYSNQTGHIIPRAGNSFRASGHLHSRGSRCKAKDVCIVMGGFCVTNAKLCGGRLVPEGCKGSKCQCCVPGTLETMIHNLEQKLQTMQANLTNANSELNMEFQSMRENLTDYISNMRENLTDANSELNMEFQTMRDNFTDYISNMRENLTDANSELTMEFQSMRENLTDSISNMVSKLDLLMSITTTVMTITTEDPTTQSPVTTTVMTTTTEDPTTQSPGYPVGFFFTTAGSSQRYKFYNDTSRNCTEAKEKCINEGLVLAEPDNPISLRKYLVETYAQQTYMHAYLGARGTGSNFRWERSGRNISNSDSLWRSGHPRSVSTSRYLLILASKSYLSSLPNRPYYAESCTTKRFTVCEYV